MQHSKQTSSQQGGDAWSTSPHTHTAAADAASDTGLRLYELNVPEQKPAALAQVTFTQNINTSAISAKGQNVKTRENLLLF